MCLENWTYHTCGHLDFLDFKPCIRAAHKNSKAQVQTIPEEYLKKMYEGGKAGEEDLYDQIHEPLYHDGKTFAVEVDPYHCFRDAGEVSTLHQPGSPSTSTLGHPIRHEHHVFRCSATRKFLCKRCQKNVDNAGLSRERLRQMSSGNGKAPAHEQSNQDAATSQAGHVGAEPENSDDTDEVCLVATDLPAETGSVAEGKKPASSAGPSQMPTPTAACSSAYVADYEAARSTSASTYADVPSAALGVASTSQATAPAAETSKVQESTSSWPILYTTTKATSSGSQNPEPTNAAKTTFEKSIADPDYGSTPQGPVVSARDVLDYGPVTAYSMAITRERDAFEDLREALLASFDEGLEQLRSEDDDPDSWSLSGVDSDDELFASGAEIPSEQEGGGSDGSEGNM